MADLDIYREEWMKLNPVFYWDGSMPFIDSIIQPVIDLYSEYPITILEEEIDEEDNGGLKYL